MHLAQQDAERARLELPPAGRADLVFTWPDGSAIHPARITDWFQQHARAAGLPLIRLHDLRHSYATAALKAGAPVKVVSQRLGHATVAFTLDTYAHVIPGMDAETASLVAGLVLGSPDGIPEAPTTPAADKSADDDATPTRERR